MLEQADVGVINIVIFMGTAAQILIQPAGEDVSYILKQAQASNFMIEQLPLKVMLKVVKQIPGYSASPCFFLIAPPRPVIRKPVAPTTCAAAGFRSCCRLGGKGCYVRAGRCWCDRRCRIFGNCCPDIYLTCRRCKLQIMYSQIAAAPFTSCHIACIYQHYNTFSNSSCKKKKKTT